MKKLGLLMCLLIAPIASNAGVLEMLKNAPASKYDIGRIELEMGALIMTEKLKGEEVEGTPFIFDGFSVDEEPNMLKFVVSLAGPAKDMSEELCRKFNERLVSTEPFSIMHRELWPDLTESQYKKLEKEFFVATRLVSKENESFEIQCH